MTKSHCSAADAGDLFIENANWRRRIVEFGQWRDFAVPPPLHAAEPHGEVFDPAFAREHHWKQCNRSNPVGGPIRGRNTREKLCQYFAPLFEWIPRCFQLPTLRNLFASVCWLRRFPFHNLRQAPSGKEKARTRAFPSAGIQNTLRVSKPNP